MYERVYSDLPRPWWLGESHGTFRASCVTLGAIKSLKAKNQPSMQHVFHPRPCLSITNLLKAL